MNSIEVAADRIFEYESVVYKNKSSKDDINNSRYKFIIIYILNLINIYIIASLVYKLNKTLKFIFITYF